MSQSPSASPSTSGDSVNRVSTFSPGLSDAGAQAPSNDHIERLAGILLTYNFYEKQLGEISSVRLASPSIYRLLC